MGNIFFFDWEISLMVFLQSFESKLTTALATFFTMLGEEYFLILILGLLYWCVNKELGRRVALITCGGAITGSLLKGLVIRRRPYMDNPEIKCIRAAHPDEDIMVPALQGYSMPSLHSSMSASLYGGIARCVRKKWAVAAAILLPFFIGLSRPYLGVHYPTDVLSGWALGAVCVLVMGGIAEKRGYKFGFAVLLIVGAAGFIYCRDDEFFSLYGVTLGIMLGFVYEERYVNFENAKKWWSYIVRPVLGVLIFAVLNVVLKLPVKNISAEEHLTVILIYRLFRYTVTTFCIIGPYTKAFKKI